MDRAVPDLPPVLAPRPGRRRLRLPVARRYAWALGAVAALAPLFATVDVLGLLRGHPVMTDLGVFRQSAEAVLHGRSLYAYAFGHSAAEPLPFTYPPFAALVFTPLAALGPTADADLWLLLNLVCLGVCVRMAFRPLLDRVGAASPAVFGVAYGLCACTVPVRYVIEFGQIGLVVMTVLLADCLCRLPRWPRGVLVGLATAVKLIPGLFVVYFLVTRQLRAALRAAAAFLLATGLSFAVDPHDAARYWSRLVFEASRVGGVAYYSNQSLYGAMERVRLGGAAERLGSVVLAAAVLLVAWLAATRAQRAGADLLALTVVGLASELVSPISWIHHLVWVVPAAGVLAGDLRARRRAVLAAATIAWFGFDLPNYGHDLFKSSGPSHLSNFLQDFFGTGTVVLLGVLALLALHLGEGSAGRPAGLRRRGTDALQPVDERPALGVDPLGCVDR